MPTARKSTAAARRTPKSDSTKKSDTEFKDVKFYNVHEGASGRMPGVYLDHVERKEAELIRAKRENRKPDLETPAATPGSPLVTADALAAAGVKTGEVHPNDNEVTAKPYVILPVSAGGVSAGSTEATDTDKE